MQFIPHKKLWLTFSSLLVIASVIVFLVYGFKLSADFTEGTLFALQFHEDVVEEVEEGESEELKELEEGGEVEGEEGEAGEAGITQEQVRNAFDSFVAAEGEEPLGKADIKKGSDGTFILKFRRLSEEQNLAVLEHLRTELGDFDLLQSRDVSPLFAKTFRDRAFIALVVASIMIILYITFAFRKVSRGIKSWKLGVAAIIALIHDIAIIVGIFVLLGQFLQVEVDALFITALLSVMGFSVNDTIVVFDRVRENLLIKHHDETFDQVAERSLQQTLARSINTSFSTLLVLVSLLVFGAYEIFYFVLALALGVVVGTYSSIFLATPLLTVFQKKES